MLHPPDEGVVMNVGRLVGRSLNLLAEAGVDIEEVGEDRENTEGPVAGYIDSMGR